MWIFLLVVVAVLIVVFFAPVRIRFWLDTDGPDMEAQAVWLHILKLDFSVMDYKIHMTLRLFGRTVVKRFLKPPKKGRGLRLEHVRALDLHGTEMTIRYGFDAPSLTGIFSAAFEMIRSLMQTVDMALYPVFLPDHEFLTVDAETTLMIGRSLLNVMMYNRSERKMMKREKRIWTSST